MRILRASLLLLVAGVPAVTGVAAEPRTRRVYVSVLDSQGAPDGTLHPNRAGYLAMAMAVDLKLLMR